MLLACDLRVRREGAFLVGQAPWTGPVSDLLARPEALLLCRELPQGVGGEHRIRTDAQLVTVGNWLGLPPPAGVRRIIADARGIPPTHTVCFMDTVGMLTSIARGSRRGPVALVARGHGTAHVTFADRYSARTLWLAGAVGDVLQMSALRRSEILVTVSRELGDSLSPHALIAPEVDWEAIESAPDSEQVRSSSTAVFIGRLESEKGPEFAIQVAAASKSISKLIVVGDGSLGPSLSSLAAECTDDLVTEFIPSLTHQEVLVLLQRARVLLAPSVSEGFPLAPFEAAAMGCAVVASNVGGMSEAVGWADNSRTIDDRSVDKWTQAVDSAAGGTKLSRVQLAQLRRDQQWSTLREILEREGFLT